MIRESKNLYRTRTRSSQQVKFAPKLIHLALTVARAQTIRIDFPMALDLPGRQAQRLHQGQSQSPAGHYLSLRIILTRPCLHRDMKTMTIMACHPISDPRPIIVPINHTLVVDIIVVTPRSQPLSSRQYRSWCSIRLFKRRATAV